MASSRGIGHDLLVGMIGAVMLAVPAVTVAKIEGGKQIVCGVLGDIVGSACDSVLAGIPSDGDTTTDETPAEEDSTGG